MQEVKNLSTVVANRRRFMQAGSLVIAGILGACGEAKPTTVASIDLVSYLSTLPKEYGGTTWNGAWEIGNTSIGSAIMETYHDESGNVRHRILKIIIANQTASGKPLTIEQQLAVAKKEAFGNLCAHEFIDTQLIPTLPAEKKANLHVLADGLAVLALTPAEQDLVNADYTNPKYNYGDNGTPFFPDPADNAKSIINGVIEWDCQSPITPDMVAAIHILSVGQKIILPGGVQVVGTELINRFNNQ